MKVESPSAKSLLLIGGNSSLSREIIDLARDSNYSIVVTSRKRVPPKDVDGICWLRLDLHSRRSIKLFLKGIKSIQFDRIICLIGGTTPRHFSQLEIKFIQNYYNTFIANLFYVLQSVIDNLKDESNIIVMSSRAVNSQSFDPHYAATKGALESFINSISRHLDKNKTAICVRSGLIIGSKMFNQMDKDQRKKHFDMSNYALLNIKQICNEIWKLTPIKTLPHNGSVIVIGAEY